MVPTFVIGLREGLEASLIVGIIAAFLVQRGERAALKPMWLGVGLAVVLCLAAASVLFTVGTSLPFRQRETMEGVLALLAVGMVSYMVVWMRRHAHQMRGMLQSQAGDALQKGTFGLAAMAFLAVLREGLESAVFLLAAFQSSKDPIATGGGAVLGISVAVILGYLIYRGGARINLGRFFGATGVVLVVVAAGLLATAVHELAEAGLVTVLQSRALDLSGLIQPGTLQSALLTGLLGFQPTPTLAELSVWLAYAAPMALFVLWPRERQPNRSPTASPA